MIIGILWLPKCTNEKDKRKIIPIFYRYLKEVILLELLLDFYVYKINWLPCKKFNSLRWRHSYSWSVKMLAIIGGLMQVTVLAEEIYAVINNDFAGQQGK